MRVSDDSTGQKQPQNTTETCGYAGGLPHGIEGAQHTPGPWHVAAADEWRTHDRQHAQWGRFDISAGSTEWASPNYYHIASVSNVSDSPQNLANARLIAAAPKMAAALDLIARRLQMNVDDGSRPDQWSMEELIRAAKAAMPTP